MTHETVLPYAMPDVTCRALLKRLAIAWLIYGIVIGLILFALRRVAEYVAVHPDAIPRNSASPRPVDAWRRR